MDRLRPIGPGVQRRVGRVPLRAPASAGVAAAQPDRCGRGFADDRVQHGGQLRDEHELAELRRRVDDEPPDADGRARRAELRVRGGRHGGGDRLRARSGPAAVGHDRELLGGPHPHGDPGAAAARVRRRNGPREPGRGAELLRWHRGADRRRRDAGDPGRTGRLAGGDQGAGHERRRLLQRELRASVREPQRVHQLPADGAHPADPVRAHLHVRHDGQEPPPGVGGLRRDVRALGRERRGGDDVRDRTGNPLLDDRGVTQEATATQSGGNLEGKEVRFGAADIGPLRRVRRPAPPPAR